MKTAISISDEVFEDAERLARRTKKSGSRLFSDALKEYVARRRHLYNTKAGVREWRIRRRR
jgi:predicted transcriptional regulator